MTLESDTHAEPSVDEERLDIMKKLASLQISVESLLNAQSQFEELEEKAGTIEDVFNFLVKDVEGPLIPPKKPEKSTGPIIIPDEVVQSSVEISELLNELENTGLSLREWNDNVNQMLVDYHYHAQDKNDGEHQDVKHEHAPGGLEMTYFEICEALV